jgi:hypothetical protein
MLFELIVLWPVLHAGFVRDTMFSCDLAAARLRQ